MTSKEELILVSMMILAGDEKVVYVIQDRRV
jgi:hypothetical protein